MELVVEDCRYGVRENGVWSACAAGACKITASEARTQLENKEAVKEKFISILKKAFHKKKKRLATKTPKQVVEKRLSEKKKAGELKKLRKKVS